MKIGYPCINYTLGCRGNQTFRLRYYSDERLVQTVESNLSCLFTMLKFNVRHGLYFFRITSDLVPFASHPICRFDWRGHFQTRFLEIGRFIMQHEIRISMHPDQFTLINAEKESIFHRSRNELMYHVGVLDAMGLDDTAKIQIHVGGVYQNRKASIGRFIRRYHQLDARLVRRLVIENDDVSFPLRDCLKIHDAVNIPIVFDVFHHGLFHDGEPLDQALEAVAKTWQSPHGLMMVDYSQQEAGARKGTHARSLDGPHFLEFIEAGRPHDFDVMLEIRDKEDSAIRAHGLLAEDPRLFRRAGHLVAAAETSSA